jgi:hypothetical protein
VITMECLMLKRVAGMRAGVYKMVTWRNKKGQVSTDKTLSWVLWLLILAAVVFGFVKLISKFSG